MNESLKGFYNELKKQGIMLSYKYECKEECKHEWEPAVPNPYGFKSQCLLCRTPSLEIKYKTKRKN